MASSCSGSMLSLRFRPCPVSGQSSHLHTSHRPIICAAVKPSPCVAVRSRLPLLAAYWGKSSDIGGGVGNLPFGGGDIGDGEGNLPFGGGDIGDGEGNLPFGGGDIGDGEGNLPFGGGDIGDGEGNLPFGGGDIGDGEGNLPFGGGDIGDGESNLPFGGGDISGGDANLPFGGGGRRGGANLPFGRGDIGGGGGGRGGGDDMAGGGGEDDMSIEGFRVLDSIVQWLRRLLQLGGASKEHLLPNDLLATMNCLIGIFTKENMECQSSSSMEAINPVGAKPSSCNGKNDEKHAVIPTVLNSTTNSMSSYSYKNTGTETMRMRATSSPVHHVIGIPDNENGSDTNDKKMKGKHGFVFYTAVGSLAYALGIAAHWTLCCLNTPLSIFGTLMGILPAAHAAVTFTSLILIGAASNFKEEELPDDHGFKVLRTVQLLVLLWLWAATFIPLHVCRGISNSVVWSFASAALCVTVVTWISIFQLTKMVIKRIKTMSKKATQWLGNLSLPECITAKFKKVRGTQRGQSQSMETA